MQVVNLLILAFYKSSFEWRDFWEMRQHSLLALPLPLLRRGKVEYATFMMLYLIYSIAQNGSYQNTGFASRVFWHCFIVGTAVWVFTEWLLATCNAVSSAASYKRFLGSTDLGSACLEWARAGAVA